MGRLDGRAALVTGSSRGIGAAIAELFAREGARVAVHGRDRVALASVAERIRSTGHDVLEVAGEVTGLDDLERMRRAVQERFGALDVLVANAGASLTPPGASIEDIEERGWRASIDSNLTATFLTLKTFVPGMKRRGSGSIITVSSAAAARPTARSPLPYAAAKRGVEYLTQQLAVQLGPSGIRVNCIAPETILTERNVALIPEQMRPSLIESHPVRRLGTPEDVARAALFLAGEESGWISGVVLDVAGGSVLR